MRYVVSLFFILSAVFGYDFLTRLPTENTQRREAVQEVISNSVNDEQLTKKQAMMRRYMEKRAEVNRVDL